MTLKRGQAPAELPCVLTLTGQGSSDKLKLTYHNRKSSEFEARVDSAPTEKVAALIPWLVKSWDADFELTEEGVLDFDDQYPGIVEAVIEGFRRARRKELEKN